MYLSNLKLWNFRRYGSGSFDIAQPNLDLDFKKGVNLLIGENDSGKSAIIDSIKLLLRTHSSEWLRVEEEDFYIDSTRLRIECRFDELIPDEAKSFTEWLSWDETNSKPYLRVFIDVSRKDKKVLPFDTKAGSENEGYILTSEAKDKLKTTYLRPLRDAINELSPKRNSRLSQILFSHEAFKNKDTHRLMILSQTFNNEVAAYFKGKTADGTALDVIEQKGKELKGIIDEYLGQFSGKRSNFKINESNLKSILETLFLVFEDGYNLGLGSHNLLCIAAELLHLQKTDWDGLRLGLVEEIEAHLHPQVQMQVMETLQVEAEKHNIQLIFTTHSPNIGSKISLENLIICQQGKVFPMGKEHTFLADTDYTFLQRFLDVTKANLFFAKGVMLVEGWSEELLLPILSKKIGINLTTKGVSIVNIASTAFLRYADIFKRRNASEMNVKVAIITDIDIKPLEAGETKEISNPDGTDTKVRVPYTVTEITERIAAAKTKKETKYNNQVVKAFISPYWTLEYCIAKSQKLRKLFYKSVLEALLEQKKDEGVTDLDNYTNAIANIDTYFNSWTDTDDSIAYAIISHIIKGETTLTIAKEKISKSIVAQRFADNLNADTVITDIQTEASLNYLFEAIKYAGNN